MGKTVRRKDMKGDGGYYEYKNDVRNNPKASSAYVHSDMPSRGGRWYGYNHPYKAAKAVGNKARRSETRKIRGIEVTHVFADEFEQISETGFYPLDDSHAKRESNFKYYWS
ncbi:hypothetical protein [Yersinia phage vB_YenM_P778]